MGTFQIHSLVTCQTFEILACAGASPGPVSRGWRGGTFRPTSTFLTFAAEERVPEVRIDDQWPCCTCMTLGYMSQACPMLHRRIFA